MTDTSWAIALTRTVLAGVALNLAARVFAVPALIAIAGCARAGGTCTRLYDQRTFSAYAHRDFDTGKVTSWTVSDNTGVLASSSHEIAEPNAHWQCVDERQ